MAEKGTKKGPILANFDQKSIKGAYIYDVHMVGGGGSEIQTQNCNS